MSCPRCCSTYCIQCVAREYRFVCVGGSVSLHSDVMSFYGQYCPTSLPSSTVRRPVHCCCSRHNTIRYDTIAEFNVDWKAE